MKAEALYPQKSEFPLVRRLRWISKSLSLFLLLISSIFLLTWGLSSELGEGFGSLIQPSTAAGFALSSAALGLWHWQLREQSTARNRKQQPIGLMLVCAAMTSGLGLLTLIEYGTEVRFSAHWLLTFVDPIAASGQMAPNTAINLVLVGLALIALILYKRVTQLISVLVCLIALLALIGHTHVVTSLYGAGASLGSGMAWYTAIGFLLLSLGLLFVHADRGVMRVVGSSRVGGIIARRLLPIVIFLPLILGFWISEVYRELNLAPEAAFALRSVLEIVIFSILVWLGARLLNQLDADRLVALDQLQQSDQRFRGIFDQTFQFVGLLRPDGTLLEMNQTALNFAGLTLEQVVGKSLVQLPWFADSEVEQLQQSILQAAAGEFVRHEANVQGANQRIEPIDFSLKPIFNAQGQVMLLLAEGRLISERKQAEAELKHSEARYRAIVEDQTELICRFGPDTTILFVNEAYCRYFAVNRADLIGKSYQPVIYAADREWVLEQVNSLSRDNSTVTIENRVVVNGEVRWTQWNNRMFFDQQGKLLELQSVGRDITQLKQIEAILRKSELQLKQLNERLEHRVAERTAELATSNALLQQEIKQRLESEQRLRRAINNAPFPILIHAEDGKILQLSNTVTEITGYSAETLTTIANWIERAYGDRGTQVLTRIQRLFELTHRVDEGEIGVKTKSGMTRIWNFSSAPLGSLPDGRRLVISMASDVTERKQAELALSNRLKQQAIVTHLGQLALSGAALVDLFDQATASVAEGLGVEYCKVLELLPNQRELILRSGVGWQDGLVGRAVVEANSRSQAGYTLQEGKPVIVEDFDTETRFQGPSLLVNHDVMSGMSIIISGRDGRPFGILGAHSTRRQYFTEDDIHFLQSVANLLAEAIGRKRDEQEIKKLNATLEHRVRERTQQLEVINQELEAFSYSVAHDLRAPLRAIQGFAQALTEDYHAELDALAQEYIQRMSLAAEHLDTLIQDLLAYSRLRQTEIRLQRVSLAMVVEAVLEDLELEIVAKQAQIDVAADLPIVLAQRTILRQIITNLVTNALKFVDPIVQPSIRIWASEINPAPESADANLTVSPEAPHWVRLWIEDNGIGIAPQHHARIFNTFERLHGVDSYSGTGIGLAIVKRGSERLGGRVGVESSLNHGSRFWVDLLPSLTCEIE